VAYFHYQIKMIYWLNKLIKRCKYSDMYSVNGHNVTALSYQPSTGLYHLRTGANRFTSWIRRQTGRTMATKMKTWSFGWGPLHSRRFGSCTGASAGQMSSRMVYQLEPTLCTLTTVCMTVSVGNSNWLVIALPLSFHPAVVVSVCCFRCCSSFCLPFKLW